MIFPTLILLVTLATIQAKAPTTCPAIDSQTSVYIPDEDCSKFWQCSNGTPYLFDCPAGLHFNPTLNVCDWPQNVNCVGPKELCDSSKCPAVDGPNSIYHPTSDCSKFCQCSNGVAYLHDCPSGLEFNPVLNVCDWPENAGCSEGSGGGSNEGNSKEESDEIVAPSTLPPKTSTTEKASSSSSTTKAASSPTEAASPTTTAAPTKPPGTTTDSPKSSSSINPTTSSSTTAAGPSTGNGNNNDGLCDSSKCPAVDGPDSVYQSTEDCTKFCQCSNGVAILHNCPEGLDFNPILNVCDWPEVAGCRAVESSSSSSSSAAPTKLAETTTDSSKSSSTSNPTTSYSTTEVASTTTEKASSTAASESSSSASPTTSSSTTKAASTTTEAASSITTVAPSTGSENNNEGLCDSSKCPAVDGPDSVYQPTEDCTKFCQCSNGVAILHNCPTGLDFNPVLNVCDWPEVAGCRAVESSSSVAPTKPSETTTDSTISSSSSNPTTLSSTTKAASSTTEAASSTTTATPTKPAESTTDSSKSSSSANPTTSATTEAASSTTAAASSTTEAASSTTEAASSTTAVTPSTGSGNNNDGICNSSKCPAVDGPDSVYQPTEDCTKFCQCSNGVAILHNCPEGLDFNPILNVCDWPEVAGCSGRGSSSSSSSSAAPTKPAESTTDSLKSSSSSNPTSSSTTEAASTTTTAAPTKPAESTTDSPKSSSPANPTTSATTKAASSTTTVGPSTGLCDSSKCPAVDGPDSVYHPTKDCTKFCQCSNGVAILHNCPAGLEFNPVLNVCDWPQNAGCSGKSSPSPSTAKPTTTPATEVSTSDGGRTSSSKKPTKPTPTSTAAPSNGRSCDSSRCPAVDGPNSVYLELDDCTKFCQCSNGVAILHRCPGGLHFSSILNVCDWPEVAGCKKP